MNSILQVLADTGNKRYGYDVDVDFLLITQESRFQSFVDGVEHWYDDRLHNHSSTLFGEIYQLPNVLKEHYELFTKQITETQTHLVDIRKLLESEVKFFGESTSMLHKKIDVFAKTSTRLIEYISSFNKDYIVGLQDKAKHDAQVFTRV